MLLQTWNGVFVFWWVGPSQVRAHTVAPILHVSTNSKETLHWFAPWLHFTIFCTENGHLYELLFYQQFSIIFNSSECISNRIVGQILMFQLWSGVFVLVLAIAAFCTLTQPGVGRLLPTKSWHFITGIQSNEHNSAQTHVGYINLSYLKYFDHVVILFKLESIGIIWEILLENLFIYNHTLSLNKYIMKYVILVSSLI